MLIQKWLAVKKSYGPNPLLHALPMYAYGWAMKLTGKHNMDDMFHDNDDEEMVGSRGDLLGSSIGGCAVWLR